MHGHAAEAVGDRLKPLSARKAKLALIEVIRDLALEDAGFARGALPLLEEFLASRGQSERAACLVAVSALYAPDAEFWVPCWDDDDELVNDPQTEISLIWYGHKGGLEDRVFRIRTARSAATSMPHTRTSHNISNVEILGQGDGRCELRCNWVTFSYRSKTVDTYFGTSFYTLDITAAQPRIKRKKVILKNDYIHHVLDIYHV